MDFFKTWKPQATDSESSVGKTECTASSPAPEQASSLAPSEGDASSIYNSPAVSRTPNTPSRHSKARNKQEIKQEIKQEMVLYWK